MSMSYPRVYLQNLCWMVELARNKRKALSVFGFHIPKGEEGRKQALMIQKELRDGQNAKVLTELLRGKKQPLDAYIKDYLEQRKKTQAHCTFLADRLALDKLLAFCQQNSISYLQSVTLKHLEVFKAQLMTEFKTTSVCIHLRHIKILFNQAERLEDIVKNPVKFLKMPTVGDPVTKFHTEEEIQKLLEACKDDPVFKYTIPLGYYLGISRNELCGTIKKYKDMIIYRRLKTKHEIIAPICEGLSKYIGNLPDGEYNFVPWKHPRTYSQNYERICKMAGVRSSPHRLRHSCGTHIMSAGGNISAVQKLLGHSQASTTERYAKILMDTLKDACSRLA